MLDYPSCKKPCEFEIHPDFLFCRGVAIRKKETIAKNREETYGANWVEVHSKNPDVNVKADFILSVAKKLLIGGRVLDVGCASGVLVNKFAKAGYSAEGIDWSEAAISFASKNMLGEFIVGDAKLDAIAGEGLYDMIVASHIVEHLEKPQGLFTSARRLLKSSGCFCVAVPNLKWYKPQSVWRRVSSIFDQDHVACYTYYGLAKILSEAGFRVTKIITRTHRFDLLTAICVSVYRRIFRKKKQAIPLRVATSHKMIQRIYNAIISLPIFPLIMYFPNRMSERNYSGMELIIVAEKEKDIIGNGRERFTYGYYEEFIHRLCEVYSFTTFQESKRIIERAGRPLVIMRHDIDMDLESALLMSSMENRRLIHATYFFMVRCPLYNVFSEDSSKKVEQILANGHHLGLHFDCALYKDISADNISYYISRECYLLEEFFGHPVEAVSFHRPGCLELSDVKLEKWPHAYEKTFLEKFKYFSDSRGIWAFGNPLESEAFSKRENLHILTHPIWWTSKPMRPRLNLVSLVQRFNHQSEKYISDNCEVWDDE